MADPRSASIQTNPLTPVISDMVGAGVTARRPANPKYGYLYYDESYQQEFVFTKTGWKIVGVQPIVMTGIGTTSQRPPAPPPGYIFYDVTIQQQVTWNGVAWISTSPSANPQPAMVGAGTTNQRPLNPPFGFVYYDSTLERQVQWSGSAWVVIGPSSTNPPVAGAPVITSPNSAYGVVGAPFTYQTTATNSPTGYGITGSGGLAAIGLSFNTSTGLLSGTPTGTYAGSVTLSATNGSGTGNLPFYLQVNTSGSGVPYITSPAYVEGVVGNFFSYQVTATNYPTSYSCDSTVALAAVGLTFNTVTGQLTGTPSGTFNSTVVFGATNAQGTGTLSVQIVVLAAPTTSGRFYSVAGRVTVFSAYPAIIGATVVDSTPGYLLFTAAMDAAQFPPGVTWQVINPNGEVIDTGTTVGGEAIITSLKPIALGGGYTAVVSTASSTLNIAQLTFKVSNGPVFSNGSVRSTIAGPLITGDNNVGTTITLLVNEIDPATTISLAQLTFGTSNEPVTPGIYTWNFNGDNTNNPKTNFVPGLTSLTLEGRATNNASSDVRIDCTG